MKIQVSDLPELSKSRLLAATKAPPQHTLVVGESRFLWAAGGIFLALLSVALVWTEANAYRWQSDDRFTYLGLVVGSFVIGWVSLSYVTRWFQSDFKRVVLVNPLYFMRFRFDYIEAITLGSTADWDIKHLSDRHGKYAGTRFQFKSQSGEQMLKVKSLGTAECIDRRPTFLPGPRFRLAAAPGQGRHVFVGLALRVAHERAAISASGCS